MFSVLLAVGVDEQFLPLYEEKVTLPVTEL